MANKCLRRCLRSGRLLFLHRCPSLSSASADRKLCMEEIFNDHASHGSFIACIPNSSICSMRTSSQRSTCLPFHRRASDSFLASAPFAHANRAAAKEPFTATGSLPNLGAKEVTAMSSCEAKYQLHHDHLDFSDHDHLSDVHHKLDARSNSCSKLQRHFRRMPVLSVKSLLRSHSDGRRHHNQPFRRLINHLADEEQESGSPTSSREAVCSWSSPSLRHTKKGGSCSSNGELEDRSSSGKGKRAPKGHVAVYVEGGRERFVVPISYFSHSHFDELLQRAESEFGFAQKGGLLLPCSRAGLQQTLSRIRIDQSSNPS